MFVDATVVLIVEWHESFLKSLISTATQHKEAEAREFFTNQNRPEATTASLRDLMAMARTQIKFKDGGRPIANVFTAILGLSPWPNDRVRAAFVDLNLIRQLIVHYGGRVLGDAYYAQLTTKGLLGVRQYKNAPPIRFIEHIEALKHIQVVVQCAIEQNRHLRDEMLQRPEWVQ